MNLFAKEKQILRWKNKCMDSKGEGGGMDWEIGIDTYPTVRKTGSEDQPHRTRELYSLVTGNLNGKESKGRRQRRTCG